MAAPNKYDAPRDRNIDWRIKALAICVFISLAFALGFVFVSPIIRGHVTSVPTTPNAQRPVYTPPSQSHSAERTEPQSPLDLEVKEHKDQTDAQDAQASQDGVQKDENGVTITLDPDNQSEQPAVESPAPATEETARPQVKEDEKPQVKEEAKPSKKPSHTSEQAESSGASIEKSRVAAQQGSGRGVYGVQAGTYKNKTSADSLASDLKGHGYGAFVTPVQVEDRTLYRVQVGQFKSRKNADDLAGKLRSDGYTPTVTPD